MNMLQQKYYCPLALDGGSWYIWIKEKMLEFFSTLSPVFFTLAGT